MKTKKIAPKKKITLYLHPEVLAGLQREQERLDRSYSWLVTQLWHAAGERVRALPHPTEPA